MCHWLHDITLSSNVWTVDDQQHVYFEDRPSDNQFLQGSIWNGKAMVALFYFWQWLSSNMANNMF